MLGFNAIHVCINKYKLKIYVSCIYLSIKTFTFTDGNKTPKKGTKLRRLFTADRNDPATLQKVRQEIMKNCTLLFPIKRKLSSVKIRTTDFTTECYSNLPHHHLVEKHNKAKESQQVFSTLFPHCAKHQTTVLHGELLTAVYKQARKRTFSFMRFNI